MIMSPNVAGVVLVSRHITAQYEGLQLTFEPQRIVGERIVDTWHEIHFPVRDGSGALLVLRWDLQCCTRRAVYRRRTQLGHENAWYLCARVDLFGARLVEDDDRTAFAARAQFTARSWEEYHTLQGLVILS